MDVLFFQMALDYDIDLSFIDDFDTSIDTFVERLFHIRVIACDNNLPDIQVFEVEGDDGVAKCIDEYFSKSSNITQLIVPNGKPDTWDIDLVTHFRIVCSEFHSKSPTNYKLDSFLKAAGITGVNSRCRLAMIIAMSGSSNGKNVNIPSKFLTVSLGELEMFSPIEITGSDVCHIPGMVLPRFVPLEIQWHILKYCQHPCATLLKNEMERINKFWDLHFENIFEQGIYYTF